MLYNRFAAATRAETKKELSVMKNKTSGKAIKLASAAILTLMLAAMAVYAVYRKLI